MKSLKQMFRRMKIRYLFMLGALAATCSIGWAVQYRGEDWNTVASFDELVQRYLDHRERSYMMCVPDWYLYANQIEPIESQYGLAGFQGQPDWYVTFNMGDFYISRKGRFARQVPHGTKFFIYEDMVSGELLVMREVGENFEEEIVYASPAWPEVGSTEPYKNYLYRELSKRRVVWEVTLKDADLAAEEYEAAMSAQEEVGGGVMMLLMGGGDELAIAEMTAVTNGLLLNIEYTASFTGTVWSVYSYDAPACVDTNVGGGGGGGPPPLPEEEEGCTNCAVDCESSPTNSFMGLERVWTLVYTNLLLTGDTFTAWTDTRSMGFDENSNHVNRFYAFGNNEVDTDDDGLNDAFEVFKVKTDPELWDTDSDGMPDGWEVESGLDPLNDDAGSDLDGDGWTNLEEYDNSSDAADPDSNAFTTYYVDDASGSDGNIGTFSSPYQSIQRGLNQATNQQWVFVKPGTYSGTNNLNLTFKGKSVQLRSLLNEASSVTVDVQSAGTAFKFTSGESTNALVQALTVTRGNAAFGGAIYCFTSSPTLRGLHLTGNQATSNGAAIYLLGASPVISECLIENNTAANQGAGIFSDHHSFIISYSPVTLKSIGSSPIIERSTIQQNLAQQGGAIYHRDQAQYYHSAFSRPNHLIGTTTIKRSIIRDNITRNGAAVQSKDSGQIDIENTEVTRNVGGAFSVSQAELDIVNCTIANNVAMKILCSYEYHFTNSSGQSETFSTNLIAGAATYSSHTPVGGAYPGNEGFTRVRNSIVWNNSPREWQIYKTVNGGPAVIIHTNLYDIHSSSFFVTSCPTHTTTSGVITNDPLFAAKTYHLLGASPAIGAAHNGWAPAEDIHGQSRPFGSNADLGAEEFVDTDADDLPDWWELEQSGNATNVSGAANDDSDGLSNLEEYENGTDPFNSDTDGDALTDGDEVNPHGTDPTNPDSDGDKIPDGWEVNNSLDPFDPTDANQDSDDDGLVDYDEYVAGTNPNSWDSDGDGVSDGSEIEQGTDPTDDQDTPEAEWFILTGDLDVDIEKERTRAIVIPAGESRVLIVGVHSAEYPEWTGQSSEYNDQLSWSIVPLQGSTVSGSINVNSRHSQWASGTNMVGFSPVYIEEQSIITAPTGSSITVEITLTAKNVGDGILPSTVMVGLPVLRVELSAVDNYDTWLPELGNTFRFKAQIYPTDYEGFFTFYLEDVSQHPGYCMNAPNPIPESGQHSDSWNDLRFPSQAGITVSGSQDDEAVSTVKKNEQEITIVSHDYAAWGQLRCEGEVDIVGGANIFLDAVFPVTDTLSAPIPKDIDTNDIGDAWTYNTGSPSDDLDELPDASSNPNVGDGLSRFQEYRGFLAIDDSVHRTRPDIPNFFLWEMDSFSTTEFEAASQVNVVEIDEDGQDANQRINFASGNQSGRPDYHLKKQYAATLEEQTGLNSSWNPNTLVALIGISDSSSIVHAVGHELGHALNLEHHGDDETPGGDDRRYVGPLCYMKYDCTSEDTSSAGYIFCTCHTPSSGCTNAADVYSCAIPLSNTDCDSGRCEDMFKIDVNPINKSNGNYPD